MLIKFKKYIRTMTDMVEGLIDRAREEGPQSSSTENDNIETPWGKIQVYEGFEIQVFRSGDNNEYWKAKAKRPYRGKWIIYTSGLWDSEKKAVKEIIPYIDNFNRKVKK